MNTYFVILWVQKECLKFHKTYITKEIDKGLKIKYTERTLFADIIQNTVKKICYELDIFIYSWKWEVAAFLLFIFMAFIYFQEKYIFFFLKRQMVYFVNYFSL